MNPARWRVRVRLTVLYSSAFLAAGAVLVVVTHWLVSQSLLNPGAAARLPSRVTEDLSDDATAEAIREALRDYRDTTLDRLLTWSIVALGVALVLAVVLGWMLAGRALQPLQKVTDTARRVADRSLHERIALTGPDDEVMELADTIDDMLERLDRSFDSQRRFVANASHELRTPLAVNRTVLEVALGDADVSDDLRRLATTVLATNERSERLAEGLLTLARAEHEITDRSVVDLAEVVAVVVEQESAAAESADISFDLQLAPASVFGSGVLLERLVANLVQNVVRHGSPGVAVIQTRVQSGVDSDQAVLEVSNAGPILREYEAEGLFEPFRRSQDRISKSRGVGLGLSIVRSVAQAHGGTVTAAPHPGGGLVVQVAMPMSARG